jgi:hypothetical protein
MGERIADGDVTLRLGMQSAGDPETLPPGAVVRAYNAVRRGGVYQCRPGYRQRMLLPDGPLQGFTWFRPTLGDVQLVFAIGGKIYFSLPPFEELVEIPGLRFSDRADRIFFARAEKSVQRQADGSLRLINPYATLIIQDGLTAPGEWNGAAGRHIVGKDTTPVGTVMAWSGGRLWVANGRRLFASDIFDPLSFFEGDYIGPVGIGAFILPGEITAVEEAPAADTPFLLVFTEEKTTVFQSNVRIRALWPEVRDFQKVIFPEIGCVAPFSVISQNGFLWWYSGRGLVNLNLAQQTNVSGEIKVADTAMAYSKRRLGPDLSRIACGSFEGYLLVSVPYADRYNRHTWCADLQGLDTVIAEEGPSWDSYWTGTRPVQWQTANIYGTERIFHISVDRDGKSRLWEAFTPDRLDNNSPISWGFETRAYLFGTKGPKQWKYAKLQCSEFWGDSHVKITWAGTTRGRYKQSCIKRISAQKGVLRASDILSADTTRLFAFKKQSRYVSTEDTRQNQTDKLDSCGTESDRIDPVDYGFQLCVMCQGPGGIRTVRVFASAENDEMSGKCEKSEFDVRATRFDGAASSGDTLHDALAKFLDNPPIEFEACATVSAEHAGVTAIGTACEKSLLSQDAANDRAIAVASMRAAELLRTSAPGFLGGFQSDACFPGSEPTL